MIRRTAARVGLLAVAMLLIVGVALTRNALRSRSAASSAERREDAAAAAMSERIRVEVLNTTRTRGLARRATLYLRDRGFDVVETGSADTALDSTTVLDRSGHPAWARRVSEAMGGARVQAAPDSSRYVDVTVLIGRSWRPPAHPFYP